MNYALAAVCVRANRFNVIYLGRRIRNSVTICHYQTSVNWRYDGA